MCMRLKIGIKARFTEPFPSFAPITHNNNNNNNNNNNISSGKRHKI